MRQFNILAEIWEKYKKGGLKAHSQAEAWRIGEPIARLQKV